MKMNKGTLLTAIGVLTLSGMRLILTLVCTNPSRLLGLRATRPDPNDLHEAFTASLQLLTGSMAVI